MIPIQKSASQKFMESTSETPISPNSVIYTLSIQEKTNDSTTSSGIGENNSHAEDELCRTKENHILLL